VQLQQLTLLTDQKGSAIPARQRAFTWLSSWPQNDSTCPCTRPWVHAWRTGSKRPRSPAA